MCGCATDANSGSIPLLSFQAAQPVIAGPVTDGDSMHWICSAQIILNASNVRKESHCPRLFFMRGFDSKMEILMHLRSLKKTKKDVSLHDPIGTDKEGNEITLIDVLGTETDEVVDAVQLKLESNKIYQHIHILDEREKEVIIGRFGLDQDKEKTQREIARELGISRSYVSRIEKRALMKLFNEFYRSKQAHGR
jgi:RNA polymerase sporulation-specific sigma factor